MTKTIHLIAAARPNFMKVAPLYHALRKRAWARPVLVHTGQHYDVNMSDAFFTDLGMPDPDIHLGVGSGSHAEQTGNVMIAYEKVLTEARPDMVVVVGDVNSTIACTLAAAKVAYGPESADGPGEETRRRPVIGHLEAGLRSFDRSMPEEVNRLATDVLADVLWTPSPDADENLRNEGVASTKIIRVGNIMIDSFEMLRETIGETAAHRELALETRGYGVVTLHRPGNVDAPANLRKLAGILDRVSKKLKLVFPVHPRTRKNLEKAGLLEKLQANRNLLLLEPQSYKRFMSLVVNCRLVVTDSGGVQEETTYLGIPCLTLRPNTERPITVSQGTNVLCGLENVERLVDEVLSCGVRQGAVPELWDGKTADRVADSIASLLGCDIGKRTGTCNR